MSELTKSHFLTGDHGTNSQTTGGVSVDYRYKQNPTYLTYRKKLFGHFFISSQGINGETAPATKK